MTEPDEIGQTLMRAAQEMTSVGLSSPTPQGRLFFLGWGRFLNSSADFLRTQRASGLLSEEEAVGIVKFNIEVAEQVLATA